MPARRAASMRGRTMSCRRSLSAGESVRRKASRTVSIPNSRALSHASGFSPRQSCGPSFMRNIVIEAGDFCENGRGKGSGGCPTVGVRAELRREAPTVNSPARKRGVGARPPPRPKGPAHLHRPTALCAAPSALMVLAAPPPGLTAGAIHCRAFGPGIGAESFVGHPLKPGAT